MVDDETKAWIDRSIRRQRIILSMWQPCSASELARWLEVNQSSCSKAIRQLGRRGLVRCLNPRASRHRIYWLTRQGAAYQKAMAASMGVPVKGHHYNAKLDWELYGAMAFPHRRAVIRTLKDPMQPSTIRRIAVKRDPTLRMSANNVRDVIKELRECSIVRGVPGRRKRSHKRYVLTEEGLKLQQFLMESIRNGIEQGAMRDRSRKS